MAAIRYAGWELPGDPWFSYTTLSTNSNGFYGLNLIVNHERTIGSLFYFHAMKLIFFIFFDSCFPPFNVAVSTRIIITASGIVIVVVISLKAAPAVQLRPSKCFFSGRYLGLIVLRDLVLSMFQQRIDMTSLS
jgi:hypothetical protein